MGRVTKVVQGVQRGKRCTLLSELNDGFMYCQRFQTVKRYNHFANTQNSVSRFLDQISHYTETEPRIKSKLIVPVYSQLPPKIVFQNYSITVKHFKPGFGRAKKRDSGACLLGFCKRRIRLSRDKVVYEYDSALTGNVTLEN